MDDSRTTLGFYERFVACAVAAIIGLLLIGYAIFSPSGSDEPAGWTPLDQAMKSALEATDPDAQVTPPQTSASVEPKSNHANKPSESPAPSAEAQPARDTAAGQAAKPEKTVTPDDDHASNANETNPDDGKLDINGATAEQLDTLPGIGASKAKAIVDYREANGRFKRVEDLLNVKGIGSKMLEKINNKIKVTP